MATASVSDSGPAAGGTFTLTATVRNAGGEASAATTLRFYRSTDTTITTADTQVGTDPVAQLAASGTSSESVSLTAPSTAGTYYYGACVDAVTDESATRNNCSSAVRITVPEPQSGPNLVVAASVSDSGPVAGAPFTLSAAVRNAGNKSSAATTLRFYRSTDATITTSDREVGTDALAGLAASGSSSQSLDVSAPSTPGTYYYGACVDAVTGESDTTNNCSSAVQIKVPEPDLVLAVPTVSNSAPAAGARFTLSATVRNDGGEASAVTTMRFYQSTDATITPSDTEVGTYVVAVLAPSEAGSQSATSSSQSARLAATAAPGTYYYQGELELAAPSTPGTYYYGACVDSVTDESETSNNCSAAVRVTVLSSGQPVQGAPDLNPYATVVTTGLDGLPPGGSFTLSVGVRNDGDGSSAATTLRYYRSTDAPITTSDTEVGTDEVPGLAPLGTSSQSVSLTAPATAGTYYYGGCVDAVPGESDTTNNCIAHQVDVSPVSQGTPDLVVSASVSDSSPDAGAAFTLSATVRNDGDGSAVATTLRYYRSTDATITTADTQVGTDAVAQLAASGTSSESVSLTAPSTPGTYYYGACVEAVTDESDTTNNCSSSVQVTVPEPEPDLVVSASVSDSGPDAGAAFTLSATVRNDGDGSAVATTLRYYRSPDATITTADTQVGTDALAGLAAAGSSSQSLDVSAPSTPGTYYYGACVDAVTGESDTTNNCSSSVTVTVATPDLVVAAPSVTDSTPDAGATFTLSATVRNDGSKSAAATTLRYYRSTDATITTSDTQVGTDEVGVLAASGTSSESVSLTASSTAGTYYYGACVDAVTGESDTTNNCSSSVTVTVATPDLVVAAPSVTDSTPDAGAAFTLSATVRNDGSESAAAATLRYYRSTDATITTADTQVGTDAVAQLAASGTSSESVSLTAPSTPGAYYYGACVDAVTDESDTTNNCSSSVQVTVAQVTVTAPDLVVAAPSVTDSTPDAGGTFTLSATVRNDGSESAAAATLRYYRSTDATITTADTQVGTDEVGVLAASGTSSESVSLTAPSTPGAYYYGACVEAVTDESDTTNNCSSSVQVTVAQVTVTAPDLVVAAPSVTDSTPDAGGTFTLSATVRNDGSESAAAATLRYYRSTDATITTADTQVGTDAVAQLAASGTSSESVSLTAPSTPGTYYYGACVDAVTDESDTTNNCSSSVTVVTVATPDLVVAAPSVTDSTPDAGAAFTLSATVRNDGDGSAVATTLRYYRSPDATITTADTQVGTDAVAQLAALGTSSESVSLTAPSTAGTYYYGACVDAVTDESDATNNCSSSVQVTVPEPDPELAPDLVVAAPTVSNNALVAGATFTLSAEVRNDGEEAAAATTLRYYRSTGAIITTTDRQVGTDEVGALAASGTSGESVSLTATLPAGTYYYGACVDAVTGESDTTNNCSSAVQVTVTAPNKPDLLIYAIVTTTNPFGGTGPGGRIGMSAGVRNQGGVASPATTVRFYQSADATITTSDTEVGMADVGAIAASGSSSQGDDLTAPSTTGTYYYGACVDSVPDEFDTTNNCTRGSIQIDVT